MQIAGMFPEELSWRHTVNTPLLQADVEQHWCPRVTRHRSFRWSLLYYPADGLEQLLPRMCENCRWGVSSIGKTGGKRRVCNRDTRCEELPFAASGNGCLTVLHSAGSTSLCFSLPRRQLAVCPWLWVGVLSFSEGIDLPGLLLCKVKTVISSQIDFILANQIFFRTEEIQIQHTSSLCGSFFSGQKNSLLYERQV